jgi:hypothetical protein
MNGVLIIPTGIGAMIGGHAGDANPVCKLLASCCDTLITHPNVVNASDINEMPENVLYVEGGILDRFLEYRINLEPVKTYNKILLVCNRPIINKIVNAVNASRCTIGADIEIVGLNTPLTMRATKDCVGCATGEISGVVELCNQILDIKYDALAIYTPIEVDRDVALDYYKNGGVNPWGGVEAKMSKMISEIVNKPVAHAPLESTSSDDEELYFIFEKFVEPRIAAEAISNCYLHCILKGLHKAPRIITPHRYRGISYSDVDFMISPHGCWGPPHEACKKANIPIIVVKENTTCYHEINYNGNVIEVENYWEAAGYIMSMRSGVHPNSVRVIGG